MIRILDPTLGPAAPTAASAAAPRPARLRGVTIGLLANGKSNAMPLLDRIAEHLRERHGVAGVLRVAKTNASAPVSEADAERLAKQCAAVVTAVGD